MMPLQFPHFTLLLILAGSITAALALYAWRRRPLSGAVAFALLMVAVTEWSLAYALTLMSTTLPTALFWDRTVYLGTVAIGPTWLAFTLHYTGREKWLTRRNKALLAIIPVITLALVWTNEAHSLIYPWTGFATVGSFQILDASYGPGFWMHIAYTYILLLIGAIFLFRTLFSSAMPRLYRGQFIAVLIGVLAPWVTSALEMAKVGPFSSPLDLAPFACSLTGLTVTWGLFRFRFLDIIPVARDAVVEGMSDGMIVLDLQGRVVDLNPAAQDLIGVSMIQAIGRPVVQLLHAWHNCVAHFQNTPEAQAEIAWERNGERSHYDLRISPLVDRRGILTGRLIVLRDVTQRVQVESQRDAILEALRRRTAELEASNQELDAFAHTVAHDLKNPLAWIVGYADLLEQEYATMPAEELHQQLRKIGRSGRNMSAIIDELLLLSSVRQAADVDIHPFHMGAIVAQVQERLFPMIEEYQAKLTLPAQETWPVVIGYAPWVEEVWVNYLINALKYGGRPPRVELGFTISDFGFPILVPPSQESQSAIQNPESKIVFWVRDNGPGIAPEDQARLFTPFTRLDQVRVKGHGLGLSIVRRIVERLGGQVGVESSGLPGQGSTFFFTLPQRPRESPTNRDN
jgi:PAS domain S-box-containing protein